LSMICEVQSPGTASVVEVPFGQVMTETPSVHGTLLFTGSVNGRSGTRLLTYEGIGNAGTGHETLRFVGRQGTGDLAGVYANITAEGDVGAPEPGCDLSGVGTYTGQVVFAR